MKAERTDVSGIPQTPDSPDRAQPAPRRYSGRATHIVATIPIGGGSPSTPEVSSDGTVYLTLTTYRKGGVSVIRGDRVVTTIPVGAYSQSPVAAPDGTVYVVNSPSPEASGVPEAVVIRGDQVATTIPIRWGPAWWPVVAPDGTVYLVLQDGTMSVIRDDRVTATIPVGKQTRLPLVAPDGTV